MSAEYYTTPNWELAPAWATHFIPETHKTLAMFVEIVEDVVSIEDIRDLKVEFIGAMSKNSDLRHNTPASTFSSHNKQLLMQLGVPLIPRGHTTDTTVKPKSKSSFYIEPNWELAPNWATHFITETSQRLARFIQAPDSVKTIHDLPVGAPAVAIPHKNSDLRNVAPKEHMSKRIKGDLVHENAQIIARRISDLPSRFDKKPTPRGLLDW